MLSHTNCLSINCVDDGLDVVLPPFLFRQHSGGEKRKMRVAAIGKVLLQQQTLERERELAAERNFPERKPREGSPPPSQHLQHQPGILFLRLRGKPRGLVKVSRNLSFGTIYYCTL